MTRPPWFSTVGLLACVGLLAVIAVAMMRSGTNVTGGLALAVVLRTMLRLIYPPGRRG